MTAKRTRSSLEASKIGRETLLLSLTEVGLGSLVHGLHIPFGGHLLSLNQGFLLSRFLVKHKELPGVLRSPVEISNCAALLKALSPLGKKLTPMLAISMQGFLFSLGPLVFGINLLGISLGMLLLSLWSFAQPLLLAYLFFGRNIFDAAFKLLEDLHQIVPLGSNLLIIVLVGLVLLKAIAAFVVGVGATYLSETKTRKYEALLLRQNRVQTRNRVSKTPLSAALRELLNPLFLFSVCLTGVFLAYSQSDKSQVVIGVLRPIAIAFVVFFCFHYFRFEKRLSQDPDSLVAQTLKSLREKLEKVQ